DEGSFENRFEKTTAGRHSPAAPQVARSFRNLSVGVHVSKRRDSKPYFRLAAIGLATALLFGCGGGGSDSLTDQPLAVQLHETTTTLTVTADSSSGARSAFEAQAMNFTFAAKVDSGRDAGNTLKGMLELKGERDDGEIEVRGRFFPDATTVPNSAEAKADFDAKRAALTATMRTDIKALSAQLQAALAAGAVRGSDGPSAAQKAALAAFKTSFAQRMADYDAAMTALNAQYRGARGYEVSGTIDENGAVKLKLNLGNDNEVVVRGNIA